MAGGLQTDVIVLGENMQFETLKPFPKQTHGPALAYHEEDGVVYLCGGVAFAEEQLCMKYDISTNNWTAIQHLPYINKWAPGESVNGNFYIFGGNGGKRNVLKYNSNDNSWIILPAKECRPDMKLDPFDFE